MRRLLLIALLAVAPVAAHAQRTAPAPAVARSTEFARLVAQLSEPGGFFDTDNLISNERGYLHVVGALERLGVRGGAYVGVGPDQSFSYIARIRPAVAFIVDIRRDNMLHHLLYKALFARARSRVEFLALLTGRPVPRDPARWNDSSVAGIVAYVDAAPATDASRAAALQGVQEDVARTGVPLSPADLATIARFHGEFIAKGLDLQFTSAGRRPQSYYPTLRQLVLERDLEGRQASYLAREADFRFLQELQRRDQVIPVVGNLAGDHALAAIGTEIRRRGLKVSALYTSNVEDYLFRDGSFPTFARTAAALPRDARSVIIRSWFGGRFGDPHPEAEPGYASAQLLQSLDAFAADVEAGGYRSWRELVYAQPLKLRR